MMQKTPTSILVVEDDEAIRNSIVELMTEEGYCVTSAINGSLGLEALKAATTLPDIILVDLMMPVMDGFEFCIEKNKQPLWAAIPTLVMSADGHVVQKQSRTKATGYIKKPLDICDLIAQLDRMVRRPGG